MLLGLGYDTLSLPVYSLPEIKELIGAISIQELEGRCHDASRCESPLEIRRRLDEYMGDTLAEAGVAR